jgi:hypothetical protein
MVPKSKGTKQVQQAKQAAEQVSAFLMRDVFAVIWVMFIAVIILLTFYGKHYIKDMIVVSILFLAFFILEPIVRMAHGSKIARMISRGKHVPHWKRFPVFFIAILIIFAIKNLLELGLDKGFAVESVNLVLVGFWLAFMFLVYYLIFSKRKRVE